MSSGKHFVKQVRRLAVPFKDSVHLSVYPPLSKGAGKEWRNKDHSLIIC